MERDWRCDIPEQRLVWAQVTSEALKIIEGKWKTIILCQLFAAKVPLRFSELERRIEGLIHQLKQLEKDGIILRTLYPEVPPRVEYSLTELGTALGPSMAALIEWALLRRETLGLEPG